MPSGEFSLATRVGDAYVPIDSALCFSTIASTASQGFADDLAEALDAQGIDLEQYYAELGHGQQETSTGHAPALRAADEQLFVRETIRGVAAQRGLIASLAPNQTVVLTKSFTVAADSPRTNIGTACGVDALALKVCDTDPATITIVLPLPPQHRLPKTGAEILFWTGFGLTLLAAGLAMMKTRRDWLRSLKRI